MDFFFLKLGVGSLHVFVDFFLLIFILSRLIVEEGKVSEITFSPLR